jgi:hypothetical protein
LARIYITHINYSLNSNLPMENYPLSIAKTEAYKFYTNIHISIYIPKTNEGVGSYKSRNRVRYCMSLRKIERKLLDKGISFLKVRELIKPLAPLIDSSVWRRNCEGVAIFAKGEMVKVFSYDTPISQQECIGDEFFTDPLEIAQSSDSKKIIEILRLLSNKKSEYLSDYL